MTKGKTNAMRILDKHKISYELLTYEAKEAVDGVTVASKIGKCTEEVFKTLVTRGASKEIYVFVVPVEKELDLKKAAKVVKEKKIEMIPVSEINKLTGYVRGGCSPVGMKKNYQTIIHESAKNLSSFVVSGGKIGLQIELNPVDLVKVIPIQFDSIIVEG
ncbi:MAG: Cys-tRNA(Pro) deacylase [Turicibacter sp.]|nr:Cys-tRNA(Pro) deacylase [Turicibacter sp.]